MRGAILWLPVVGWMVILLVLAIRPTVPGAALVWDKLAHVLAYAVLALACLRATHGGFGPLRSGPVAAALALTLTYGALAEWVQAFAPPREPSLADWLADAVGAVAAVPIAAGLARLRGAAVARAPRGDGSGVDGPAPGDHEVRR